MSHEETIRIYRSDVPGAEPPSLTYGELAANLYDKKLFVGGTGGTANMLVFVEGANASVPLASNSVTGVASFRVGDFTVSGTGHVSLANNQINVDAGSGIAISPSDGKILLGGTVTIANSGVTSFNGQTGSVNLIDFISAGDGIALVPKSGNTVTDILNTGVLSLNGLTGARTLTGDGGAIFGAANTTIGARISEYSVTGVASFSSSDFGVSTTGHVSLTGNVARTNLQNSFAPSQVFLGGLISAAGITSTGLIETTDGMKASGLIRSFAGFSGPSAYISGIVHPSSGLLLEPSDKTLLPVSGAIKIESINEIGSSYYTTLSPSVNTANHSIDLPDASGTLALQSELISVTADIGSGIKIDFAGTSRKFTNIGVTGITTTESSGIILLGNTGNVTILNAGVRSFNSQTGVVSYAPPVASVGTSGVASFLSDHFTVSPTGHVSLASTAVTVTGDGGALFGASNSVIGARLANNSLTGVASFTSDTFVVANGMVSIGSKVIANDQLTNSTIQISTPVGSGLVGGGNVDLGEIITIRNIGVTGISAGHTGIAISGTTGNVQVFNMGVLSINGQTGHYTLPPVGATGDTVLAGSGIVIPETSGNTRTIINVGVTGISAGHTGISFSGTTGNIQVFNMGVLSIDGQTGHVDLQSIVGATGDTVSEGNGISVNRTSTNSVTVTNIGVTSILRDAATITGDIRFNPGKGITFAYGTGGLTFANTGVLTINGNPPNGEGNFVIEAATVVTGDGGALVGDGVRINARIADNSVTGVASFNPTFFTVSSGQVGLSGVYGTVGVTGLSAGHTGIALVGTTGNVRIFNMGVHTFNGQTGHVTFSVGATGDTVVPGVGINVVPEAGNVRRIHNMGVTSFNGLTGAIRYAPPLATAGASGVASFLSRDFAVSGTGHVSLSNNWIEINSGQGINVVGGGRVELGQSVVVQNTGVTSFNGSTGSISLINFVQGDGIATQAVGNKVVFTNIGVTSLNGLTGARTLTGDGGAIIGAANTQIGARLATTGATGVASFDGDIFTVTAGKVGLTDGGIINRYLNNSQIKITTGSGLAGGNFVSLGGDITLVNVGVTGISAGHTGIALDGTTGNIRIFNMGILSINGQTGHYTLPVAGATGDTVVAGVGINVVSDGGNVRRIHNMGVTSFNGLTGAVTYAPAIATTGASGVASFSSTNFAVSSTGHVSIRANGVPNSALSFDNITINTLPESGLAGGGNVALGGIITLSNAGVTSAAAGSGISLNKGTGAIIITNTGVTGISAGHTGIALIGTTGNVRVFNMGVHTFNGQTGHVTFSVGATGDTVVAGSGIAIPSPVDNTKTIINVGVTGIGFGNDVGLTGKINLTAAAGSNITISQANNLITIGSNFSVGATGDTVVAGVGISVVRGAGTSVVTINNMGVTSFNGMTGAVSMTGDGGALAGIGNNVIRARLASISLTGVASFSSSDFGVSSTGHVSLTGNVARTNVAQTFTATQTLNGGLSVAGITATGTIVTTNSLGFSGPYLNTTQVNTGRITHPSGGNLTIEPLGQPVEQQAKVRFFSQTDPGILYYSTITTEALTNNRTITFPDASGTVALTNNVVTTVNSQSGAVTLTGDGGAIIGAGNNIIRARNTATGVTGVASFNTDHFNVSSTTGHVSLAAAYQATGDTVITVVGSGIAISTSGRTDTLFNIGVTGLNGLTGNITLTGDGGAIVGTGNNRIVARLVTTGTTGVASFNTTHFTVSSSTGHVSLNAAYTVTGDTVRGDNDAIIVGNPSGTRLKDVTVRVALASPSKTTPGTTGVASFYDSHFLVDNGFVKLLGGSDCQGPLCPNLNSGLGASGASDGSLAYLYLDVGNLSSAPPDSIDTSADQVIVFDSSATSLVKTKKTSVKQLILDSSALFTSTTSNQLEAKKGTNSIEYAIRTSPITQGDERLVKAGDAYSYITQNTVANINGKTGAVGCIAVTCDAQSFTGLQTFVTGISAANIWVSGGATFSSVTATTFNGTLNGNASTATTASNANSLGGTAANSWALQSWVNTGLGTKANTSGNNASGTWPINITGSAASATTATTATTATNATQLGGTGADLWALQSWVTTGLNTKANTTGNNATGTWPINITGNAATATTATSATTATTANQVANTLTIGSGLAGGSYNGSSAVTIANIGVTSLNGLTGARTLTGDGGAIVGVGNDAIRARLATTGATGVASFSSTNFDVSAAGAVSIKTNGVPNSALSFSSITINSGSGLDGGGSINLGGTLTLSNSGVTAAVAGSGIRLNKGTGEVIITNIGVTSFNGATGAVSYAPPFATASITGVASFPAADFNVVAGAVSLTGNVARTNVAQTFTATQIFTSGLSGNLTGNATTATNSTQLGGTGANLWALQSWVTTGLNGKADTSGSNATGTWPINITGNAASAATATNSTQLGGTAANSWALQSWVTSGLGTKANTSGDNATGTWPINITGNAATATTATSATTATTASSANQVANALTIGTGLGGVSYNGSSAVTITNSGVLSFNSQTGAVSYAPPLATASVTGVASFNTTRFTVTTGAVDLAAAYQVTGDTIAAGQFINFSQSGNTKTINNIGVQTLNGLTGARTLTGDGGALAGVGNDTIRARLATASLTGVASFSSSDFGVSSTGHVSLTGTVARTQSPNTFTSTNTFNATTNFSNAMLGLSAASASFGAIQGNTINPIIIRSSSTTSPKAGSLRFESDDTGDINYLDLASSVLSNSRTITLPDASGTVALTNSVVTSVNGQVGAVALTGDGGALVGSSNNTIRARVAGYGVTGVASFSSSDFGVSSTGHVSLTGNVARTNAAQTFTALQSFSSGLSASGGITFNSPITTNGYRYGAGSFETKTAGFSLAAGDNGKVFVMTNTTNVVVTVEAGLPVGFACEFLVTGAGRVDISAGNGVTLLQYSERNYQYARVQLISYATDTFFHSVSYHNY